MYTNDTHGGKDDHHNHRDRFKWFNDSESPDLDRSQDPKPLLNQPRITTTATTTEKKQKQS